MAAAPMRKNPLSVQFDLAVAAELAVVPRVAVRADPVAAWMAAGLARLRVAARTMPYLRSAPMR